jgi:glycosyltransferase involved in cell wall biosynthesis
MNEGMVMTVNVLFVTPQISMSYFGGAEVQILRTKDYFDKKRPDVHVKLFDMWRDDIKDYDIIHIFNPTGFPFDSLRLARYAKTLGIKVITTPIYFDSDTLLKEDKGAPVAFFWKLFNLHKLFPFTRNYLQYVDPQRFFEELLRTSDLVLPNTVEELKLLSNRFFEIPPNKYLIIPNGADLQFKDGNEKLFETQYNVRDFILYVGRLETRKNVIRLIKAFVRSGLKTHLVIIGDAPSQQYVESCKGAANENVLFIPPLPHSDLLMSAYKAAKVVALPSYYETPGLAALEGGLAGANVVITAVGGTKEYFGDFVWYVNPRSVEDIKKALILAYNSSKTSALSKHIENNFTWEKVAQKTADAYYSAVSV